MTHGQSSLLLGGASLALALFAGVSLGRFVVDQGVTRYTNGTMIAAAEAAEDTDGYPLQDDSRMAGWDEGESNLAEPVVCKGCGPGLSERRAYAMGYDDPVVRDYMNDPRWRDYDRAAAVPDEGEGADEGPIFPDEPLTRAPESHSYKMLKPTPASTPATELAGVMP